MRKLQGKELIELIKEDPLLLRYKELRSEDVVNLLLATRSPRKTALRRTNQNIRMYVLRFFEDGINAYLYLFDNASIYYTATAVEMGLLFKLRNKIKQVRKGNPIFNPKFNWLIDNSNLDKNTKKLAHNIRIMRNCYIHYGNIIAYYARQREVDIPALIKQGKLRPEAANLLSRDKEYIPIRIEHLETNKEIMPFIENRIREHLNWVGSAMSRIDTFKKSKGYQELSTLDEVLLIYGVEAFDALTCIKWSFKILKALYII